MSQKIHLYVCMHDRRQCPLVEGLRIPGIGAYSLCSVSGALKEQWSSGPSLWLFVGGKHRGNM